MLLIKKEVNLEELEKFGFESNEDGYYFEDGTIYPIDYIQIYTFSREVFVFSINNTRINCKLFDLIKAGFIEKE